ncbi:hypothetical protein RHMOL_Rhmol08G0279000 [Rhododendron molle]|uniref:Uncharacterized protein n=1 Tax=Rhododendron molle TaxID=49168 RepID=A0ACC0MTA5_RHOML|nr:hypothetical protein RHMOL_Rhmol08G0279000 [Rhododendron molle]
MMETRSPVRVKFGQAPVPSLRAVDLANQRLRCAEHFLLQNDVVLALHISTVDLRDQWLGGLGQAPVRISLGQGILGGNDDVFLISWNYEAKQLKEDGGSISLLFT